MVKAIHENRQHNIGIDALHHDDVDYFELQTAIVQHDYADRGLVLSAENVLYVLSFVEQQGQLFHRLVIPDTFLVIKTVEIRQFAKKLLQMRVCAQKTITQILCHLMPKNILFDDNT